MVRWLKGTGEGSMDPAGLVDLRAGDDERGGEGRRLAVLPGRTGLEGVGPPLRLRRRHEEGLPVGRGVEPLDVPPFDEQVLAPALRLRVEELEML